jgi:ATP-dependent DNA helicase RecG
MSTTDDTSAQLPLPLPAPLPSLPQLWTPDDIYNNCGSETVKQFKEDARVEQKVATISQKLLAEYASMWANTQPFGGIVFLGIEDGGQIAGCASIEQSHLNDLESVRVLCPDARLEFKKIEITNKRGERDFVLVMRVRYRDDKLVETTSGEAFIREGDRKRRLTEEEKREIRLNKGELDVESERTTLKFPNDFDFELLRQYRTAYISKRRLEDRFSIEDVLHLSKLGKKTAKGFEPNLGAALLFANDPTVVVPGAYIRIRRYDGAEEQFGRKLNVTLDEIISGPLPVQITHAERVVQSHIRNFIRLGRDGRFASTPEFPKDVWLEAIVNAVVHRSYNLKNMNIFVKMFEDKFVVESPGAFLPPTTAETVFDAHNPRNPNTMWALYYFDFVQCAFEGTRRMRSVMREANLPDPIFVQKMAGTFQVAVTLQNDAEHRKVYVRSEAAAGINPEMYASLSESEKLIVNFLVDKYRLNVTDAGLVVGMDWNDTKILLDGLEAKGVIKRSPGKPRSRHRFYHLAKRPRITDNGGKNR